MARTNHKSSNAAKKTKPTQPSLSLAKKETAPVLKSIIKKMKSKKLEDRIAPGMVGGGIVDPGAGDFQEQTDQQAGTQEQALTTNIDNTQISGDGDANSSGQYIDDHSSVESAAYSPTEPMNDSYHQESLNQDLGGFSNGYDSGAMEPMDDSQSWKEPDWVTANADGSVHVQPPAGVSVDSGIANFPMEVANEDLPIPEEITLQADGSAKVDLPEGAAYNVETNVLTMPAEGFNPDDVPKEFSAYQNPDGDWNIQLPAQGIEYNADTNSLNISNDLLNEIAPNNIDINTDGSISMALPEGTTVNADGSWDMPAGASEFMDSPPPQELTSLEFSETHSDGSVSFELPQGAVVEDGIATFPYEMTDQLPIPEDVSINQDGSMDIQVPEGTQWNADAGTLTFPAGEFKADDIPEGINYTVSEGGAYCVSLPDGMSYDNGSVHCSNYWANEIAPEPVHINGDGSISVELPQGTDVESSTEFTIPAEQTNFLEASNPDYVHDAGFAEPQVDGSYDVVPPMGCDVSDGQINFPYAVVAENLPVPEGVTLNADGTMDVQVPEGTKWDADAGTLTFPAGSLKIDELPTGIDFTVSADGALVAELPEGIAYNDGVCHLDNYWANEIAPEPVSINTDGSVAVTLPTDTIYHDDGSLTIPESSADFVQAPEPLYVAEGPEWIDSNPDGSVTVTPPQDLQLNPDEGVMTMSTDQVMDHFENQVPENFTLNADGTADVKVPEGTTYNADSGLMTLPADSVNIHEIPAQVGAFIAPDGSVCVPMQDGMSFDANTGAVHLDNYWTNELAPQNVEVNIDGSVEVTLPSNTQYHEDGSFTVPATQADFVATPEPTYVAEGPEWVSLEGNGSVTFEPPTGIAVNADQGTMTMPVAAITEHFESEIPHDVTLNADGTADVKVPEGTVYDASANALTFPAGSVSLSEVPEGIQASLNDQGQVTVELPQGIDYSNGTCHFDNYWTNEFAPQPVQISAEGQVTVDLPSTAQFHDDGSFSLPPNSADFLQNPEPAFVSQGPDWVEAGPNGSVTFAPPPDVMSYDGDTHSASISVDAINQHFESQIPPEVTLNADGTMQVQVPEGTTYDATANSLTFPAGTVNLNEVPPGIMTTVNPDGGLTVQLPQGIDYNNGVCQFDNHWTNEMLPPHMELGTDGMMQMQMPSDTTYHSDGSFSVPAGSTDFMQNPEPPYVAGGPDWAVSHPDGSVAFQPPPGQFQMDPNAGTVSMSVDAMYEHFDHSVPHDVTFNPDGTMDVKLPEGTQFNDGVLTFSAGAVNINEIPQELAPQMNADGNITVALPQGMQYNADLGTVHCNNEWTNTLTPEPMNVQTDGTVTMTMPPGTQYYPQGMVVPADQAYFAAPAEYQPAPMTMPPTEGVQQTPAA